MYKHVPKSLQVNSMIFPGTWINQETLIYETEKQIYRVAYKMQTQR